MFDSQVRLYLAGKEFLMYFNTQDGNIQIYYQGKMQDFPSIQAFVAQYLEEN